VKSGGCSRRKTKSGTLPLLRIGLHHGDLDFGPWDQIFYGEFDGGRKKRALMFFDNGDELTINLPGY
jgi:hypothetical protein